MHTGTCDPTLARMGISHLSSRLSTVINKIARVSAVTAPSSETVTMQVETVGGRKDTRDTKDDATPPKMRRPLPNRQFEK